MTKPFAPRGRETVHRVTQAVFGQCDELAGVGGVGPDLGDLRLGEAQAPEKFASGVPVGHVGGCHRDHHGQAERVDGDVSLASVDLLPSVVTSRRLGHGLSAFHGLGVDDQRDRVRTPALVRADPPTQLVADVGHHPGPVPSPEEPVAGFPGREVRW